MSVNPVMKTIFQKLFSTALILFLLKYHLIILLIKTVFVTRKVQGYNCCSIII